MGFDPHEPRDNILAGTFYLAEMHERFGYPGLFAAYNAGPARYARHLATGQALPAETRAYVARVTSDNSSVAAPSVRTQPEDRARLFFPLSGNGAGPEDGGCARLAKGYGVGAGHDEEEEDN